MEFHVPEIEDNSNGWGPMAGPSNFADIPFAPFSKGEKIGRCADFTQGGYKYGQNRFRRDRDNAEGGVETVFDFKADENETDFHLVDSRPVSRPTFARRRPQFNRRNNNADAEAMTGAEREKQRRAYAKEKKRQHWGASYWNQLENRQRLQFQSSVEIRPDWTVIEQFDFAGLTKLSHAVKPGEDIMRCGHLRGYERALDRLTPKFNKALAKSVSSADSASAPSTSDDPIIQKLAKEGKGKVFATDGILAALMCAPRSNHSWDVVAHRVGDKLFFDRRDSKFDRVTVSETAQGLPEEERDSINSIENLKEEASLINANLLAMAQSETEKGVKLAKQNPFKGSSAGSGKVGYAYRKWTLTPGCDVVVRCGLDTVVKQKTGDQVVMVRALNEYDSKVSGVDYRQKLENQRGAVMATELKNNANKLAKWTVQALLSESDLLKFAFVSRTHMRSSANHEVLSTQAYKPKDFATQINLNSGNMWGVTKCLVEKCMSLPEGKYLIIKDPNKPLLRLYDVPMNAFDTDYADEAM